MTTVLIAVDETQESVEAARAARRLIGEDAEYLAINVIEEIPTADRPPADWRTVWGVAYPVPWGMVWPIPPPPTDTDIGARQDAARRDARDVAERAGLAGATAVGDVGDPAEAILDAAERCHADVIVVGSHERGWLDRLLSPSVSSEVVEHADVPVLIAK